MGLVPAHPRGLLDEPGLVGPTGAATVLCIVVIAVNRPKTDVVPSGMPHAAAVCRYGHPDLPGAAVTRKAHQ